MKTYNKRILLSVTGKSPAVVTETLYALVTEKNFIPTEIQVITTIEGRNELLSALLGIEGKRKGALQEFIEDYGSQYGFDHIHFNEDCVHIIKDTNGEQLPDIITPNCAKMTKLNYTFLLLVGGKPWAFLWVMRCHSMGVNRIVFLMF